MRASSGRPIGTYTVPTSLLDSEAPGTRAQDVTRKHARVCEFLEDYGLDVLVLASPSAFSWFTCGGRNTLGTAAWGPGLTCAVILVDRFDSVVLAEIGHADRLRVEQLHETGLRVEPIPWTDSPTAEATARSRGRRVGSDIAIPEARTLAGPLARLRIDLTQLERHRYRQVGWAVSYAVEATARSLARGESEPEIAAQLAHRLIKRHVVPWELHVAADGRSERFRQPTVAHRAVDQWCYVAAAGELFGLVAAAGRTVCFGEPPQQFQEDFEQAAMTSAAAIYHSRPNMTCEQVLGKIERAYQRRRRREEYTRSSVGAVAGYSPCELPITPGSTYRLGDQVGLIWRPSFGAAQTCDTIIVDPDGFDIITGLKRWPQMQIEVGGHRLDRPGLLVR